MQRAPVVIASTAAGLVAVLGYNPHSGTKLASSALTAVAGTTTAPATTAAATTASGAATTTAATTKKKTAAAAASRSATGSVVQISEGGRPFGEIQVKATVQAGKVTAVEVVQLNPFDDRSANIDSYAVPQLAQESISAGSAKIDVVSGATYTSEAYVASLQAALDKLA